MNVTQRLAAGLLLALSWSAVARAADGFTEMFNGQNLDGWVVEGSAKHKADGEQKPVWTVEEGQIVCAKNDGFGFLRYDKQEYADFLLHLEYRMSKNCNSGVGIRTVKFSGPAETRPSYAAYEVQLLEDAGKKPDEHSSFSLYRYVSAKENPSKPAGEWNTLEIQCVGPKIRITANDKLVLDVDQSSNDETKAKPLSGYLSLQNHGGRIEFRNVRVKDLKNDLKGDVKPDAKSGAASEGQGR